MTSAWEFLPAPRRRRKGAVGGGKGPDFCTHNSVGVGLQQQHPEGPAPGAGGGLRHPLSHGLRRPNIR
jgi:hypothetical protein